MQPPGEGAERLDVFARDDHQIDGLRPVALGMEDEVDAAVLAADVPGRGRRRAVEAEADLSGRAWLGFGPDGVFALALEEALAEVEGDGPAVDAAVGEGPAPGG